MAIRACGTCGEHRTHQLRATHDAEALEKLWGTIMVLPEPYVLRDDSTVWEIWQCEDCDAFTWDEAGESREVLGRYTWRRGEKSVVGIEAQTQV